MARFLLLPRYQEGAGPIEGSAEHDLEMSRWRRVNDELTRSGELVWSMALDDPAAAVAVTAGPGTADGPRVERGRAAAPGGVFAAYLLDVGEEAAAVAWARRMPVVDYGTVEVRAVPAADPVAP